MAKIIQTIIALQFFLQSKETIENYRVDKKNFTREGIKGFEQTVLLIGSQMRGSLSFNLYKTLNINNLEVITKSGYSQNRYKVKADFFKDWNTVLLENVYASFAESDEIEGLKKYKGYYLEAIDGTKITLPNTTVMQTEFGSQLGGPKTAQTQTAQCMLMCSYDVLNHYYTKADVVPLNVGEITVAKGWASSLKSDTISVFDRGFGSLFLFSLLNKYKKPFLMRLKINFNRQVTAFVSSGKTDEVVSMTALQNEYFEDEILEKGQVVRLRLIRVLLSTGEVEILATNLMDKEIFTASDFYELYGMRWGIETSYDRLKNKFLIACFSGLKPESIYQDIYATIFIHNLHSLISNKAQEIVNEEVKDCKYDYSTNKSISIAIFKEKIMTIFLSKNPKKIVQELIILFAKYKEPIRPNRHYKRTKSVAKRRNIITQTNYKRN